MATNNSNTQKTHSTGTAYIMLAMAAFFWGGNTLAGKMAVGVVPPISLVLMRWVLAAIIVAPFALPHLRRDWPLVKKNLILLLSFGALGLAAFNMSLFIAARTTSVLNLAIEQSAIPVFVLLLNFALFRTKVHLLQIIGVSLTIFGVMITATYGDLARIVSLDLNSGDVIMVLGSIFYAAYTIALRYRPDIHWLSFMFIAFVGASIGSAIAYLVMGTGDPAIPHLVFPPLKGLMVLAYAAILPTFISQVFYLFGVNAIGPNRASIFINLIPVFAAILAVIILHENFQTYHWIATITVVAGISLAEFSGRKKG